MIGLNNLQVSKTVSLNHLKPYAVIEASLGNIIPPVEGINSYSVKIVTPNDDLTNDDISFDVNRVSAVDMMIQGAEVEMDVMFDSNASDFSFVFDEGTPSVLDVHKLYGAALNAQIIPKVFRDFRHVADGTVSETFTINNYDCHYFAFFDQSENGLNNSSTGNGITISTRGGSVFIDGDYDEGKIVLINFIECLPTSNSINIDLNADFPTATLIDGTIISAELGNPGTVEGAYTVIGDNVNGCDSVVTYNITENVDLGINYTGNLEELSLFPNPAKEFATLKLSTEEISDIQISMYNSIGKQVFIREINNSIGTQNINLKTSNLSAGIYSLLINMNGSIQSRKLIID